MLQERPAVEIISFEDALAEVMEIEREAHIRHNNYFKIVD